MVERRREQVVEEGGLGGVIGWQALPDGAFGCLACVLSFPLCGNGLCKPLDSGLRRAATGFLPSRRIPDFLSVNDGKGDWGVRLWTVSGFFGVIEQRWLLFPPYGEQGSPG